jgi:two-component system LytT family response regulator
MILSCIIIDDEELTIHHLIGYIDKVPFLRLEKYFTDASDAFQYLQSNSVDVILLDIEMPNNTLSGLDFIKLLGKDQNYILTTGHIEYAIKGFEYSVVDFLHKPYSFERFLTAIKKVENVLKEGKKIEEEIFVKIENKYQKILFKDICYIQSEKNNVSIYTEKERINAIYTLSDIEEKLPKHLFIRVHKSFIISLSKIEMLDNNEITIRKGDIFKNIPLGEHYKKALMSIINNKIPKR